MGGGIIRGFERRNCAGSHDPFTEFDARRIGSTIDIDDASRYGIANCVFGDELVEASGHHLLDGEAQLTLFAIDLKHLRLDAFAHPQDVRRVIDPLLRGDLGDVNQPFYALGHGDECTELGELRDGAFDDRARVNCLHDFGKWIAQCLLEAQTHALLFSIDRQDDDFHLFADLDDV